jgi:5-methylcytosine-specific restriction endonuclease McrA
MRHFATYQDYLGHWLFRAIRETAMQKAGRKCVHCGADATEVHHAKYPKPWGAFDVPANLEPICHACHCAIHGKAS